MGAWVNPKINLDLKSWWLIEGSPMKWKEKRKENVSLVSKLVVVPTVEVENDEEEQV